MDVMVISYIVFWFLKLHSLRLYISYISFYAIRGFIQSQFLMPRAEGYLWPEDAFPSMVITYAGTNDFFYSGHVGSCVIALREYHAQGYGKMCYVIGFILTN